MDQVFYKRHGLLFMAFYMYGDRYIALIDTGASMSFIDEAVITSLEFKKSKVSARVVSHEGEADKPYVISNKVYKPFFPYRLVSTDLNFIGKDISFIFGLDLLRYHKIILDFTKI